MDVAGGRPPPGGGRAARYQQALAGNVGAICFWLKNRRPHEWRDVQNINADVGHYIISDKPMTEAQWIAERTKVIEHQGVPRAFRCSDAG
jgi:hypothetical protein